MLKAKNYIYFRFQMKHSRKNPNNYSTQKLHQTIMKIKKSFKKQLLIIFFAISLSLLNWVSGLKAQSNYTYYEHNQAGIHVSKQDTTRVMNLSEIPIIEKQTLKKEKAE